MSIETTFLDFVQRLRAFMAGSLEGPGASESRFSSLALELFALQFEHVPIFRQFCEGRGRFPGQVACWRDIPALPTRAFQDFEVSSLPTPERTRVFLSSGTQSQSRSRQYHGDRSLQVYEASLVRWFVPHLLPEISAEGIRASRGTRRGLALAPSPIEAPNSSLVHMFETVAREISWERFEFAGRLGSDGWDLDMKQTLDFLDACVGDDEPVIVLGTAFSFVHLLDELALLGRRLALPGGSRVMETGGYKGRSRSLPREELHALIEAGLGIPRVSIVREYGMAELSSQAYDRVAGQADKLAAAPLSGRRWFRFPPWARARVVSPETGAEVDEGQTGIVQVFDLANVFSALAVQTEDLAVRHGLDFELAGRATEAQPRGCSLMMNATES